MLGHGKRGPSPRDCPPHVSLHGGNGSLGDSPHAGTVPRAGVVAMAGSESGYILPTVVIMLLVLTTMVWAMSTVMLTGTITQFDRRDQDAAVRAALSARAALLNHAREIDRAAAVPGAWRAAAAAGGLNFDSQIGEARVTTSLVDPGGNFTDNRWETAVFVCTATVRNASYSFRQVLAPAVPDALMNAVFSAGVVEMKGTLLIHGNAHSNDFFRNDKRLIGDATAVNGIEAIVTGDSDPAAAPVPSPIPDPSWYLAVGTVLPYQDKYEKILLSPTKNPFGAPNPYGVYIIDPPSPERIEFKNMRVVGTLVVLNMYDQDLQLKEGFLLERYRPEQMALLVVGDEKTLVKFEFEKELKEEDAGNMNPPGVPHPWPNGTVDVDDVDEYPARIYGDVYSPGEVEIRDDKFTMWGSLSAIGKTKLKGHVGWISERQFTPLIGMEGYGLIVLEETYEDL